MLDIPFRTIINMGKTTTESFPRGNFVVINPPDAVLNAADKRRTKEKFVEHQIPTAEYWPDFVIPADKFPIVVKHRFGSRGTGVYLIETPEKLAEFFRARGEARVKEQFIAERFKNYRYEYRVHATQTEVFLANRKARQEGVPQECRWKHSFGTSVWFNEDNPEFRTPSTWEEIKAACCRAVAALGMDFAAIDVKVSMSGKFFLIEANSAPSLGDATREHYLRVIPELARKVRETRGTTRIP